MRGTIRNRGTEKRPRWTVYWWATDPSTGRRRQRSKGGFLRKRDAQRHLSEVLAGIADGTYAEPTDKKMTVGGFLVDVWLPAVRTGATRSGTPRRSTTIGQYEAVVRSWIIPAIGGVRLVALVPADVERMLRDLADRGGKGGRPLSGRSCQVAYGVLRQALDHAQRAGYVSRNVAGLVDRPGAVKREMRCWTAAEAQKFLTFVADDPLYVAWALFLARGLRRGEVAGLRWQDVDLDAGTLRIVHTRVSVGGKVETSEPKTAAGRRTIHLDPGLVGLLREHRKHQMEARLACGPHWQETGYVVVRDDGRPPHPEHFSDRFEVLCKAADVPVIRLHDLRHTAVSLALADGTPIKVVQELAGHSSPTITASVYAHSMPGQHEAAGARLSGILGLSGAGA
ncbi:site-specific integrase [Pseudonocardia sp. C8]|uniref:site-specific integrase n=1 Tax=Pseudonocardia sp. C8 TaxID=2762759 RepID=UPI00164326E6|nr:site-specific integrase [Pseudonocardia sp. C8]MBC3191650.1 site-specific integrase [Pseudonocardia sp. C8]